MSKLTKTIKDSEGEEGHYKKEIITGSELYVGAYVIIRNPSKDEED